MPRSRVRVRQEEPSSSGMMYLAAGALLGLGAGLYLADRFGGFSRITRKIRATVSDVLPELLDDATRERRRTARTASEAVPNADLEERVLEAFRNDPILAARAVDIGAIGDGVIELSGWVHAPSEARHALTITGGVPGVESVVNRLDVRDEADRRFRPARDQQDDGARGAQSGIRGIDLVVDAEPGSDSVRAD
jgi:hypothetical protein